MKLPDKISEKIESLDEKNLYYILGGVLLLFFLLDYFVLMRPQLNTLSKISPEIKILKEDISKAENDIARVNQYTKQVEDLKVQIAKSNNSISAREEVPLILEQLSRFSTKCQVKIDQIIPNTTDQDLILENNERRYYTLPIQIDARSGYHDFGKFINEIENGDTYLQVASFKIAATKSRDYHAIKLSLLAIVYEEVN